MNRLSSIHLIVTGIILILAGVFLLLLAARLLPSISFLYKRKSSAGVQTDTMQNNALSLDNNNFSEIQAIIKADSHLRSLLAADPSLTDKIQTTLDYYKPTRGRFTAWWQRGKAEGRVALQKVLNEEQILIIQQAATLENEVREGRRREVEYNVFLARHAIELMELKARAKLIDRAFDSGMSVDDYSGVNKEQALSSIRTSEFRERTEIEKDLEAWRIEQNLSAAERYKMAEDSVTNRLRDELIEAITKRDELAQSNHPLLTKNELIAIQNQRIDNLKFRVKAREKRLADDEA